MRNPQGGSALPRPESIHIIITPCCPVCCCPVCSCVEDVPTIFIYFHVTCNILCAVKPMKCACTAYRSNAVTVIYSPEFGARFQYDWNFYRRRPVFLLWLRVGYIWGRLPPNQLATHGKGGDDHQNRAPSGQRHYPGGSQLFHNDLL